MIWKSQCEKKSTPVPQNFSWTSNTRSVKQKDTESQWEKGGLKSSFDFPAKGIFHQQQCSRSFSCLFSFPGGLSTRICRCKRFTSVPKLFQNSSWTYLCFFIPSERCFRKQNSQNRLTYTHLQKYRHYTVCAAFQTHAPFKHTAARTSRPTVPLGMSRMQPAAILKEVINSMLSIVACYRSMGRLMRCVHELNLCPLRLHKNTDYQSKAGHVYSFVIKNIYSF